MIPKQTLSKLVICTISIIALILGIIAIYQIRELSAQIDSQTADQLRLQLAQESSDTSLDEMRASINKLLSDEQQKASDEEEAKHQNDLDQTLVQYKLDTLKTDLSDSLLTAAYNSPTALCPNVIATQTTRNNVYYYVLDDYESLVTKYSQYREDISYIDNNLNGKYGLLQIVRDQCSAIGYILPVK